MKIIDGKMVAEVERASIKAELAELSRQTGKYAGLAVILVGDDPASQVYVRNKMIACQEVGIHSTQYLLGADSTDEDVLQVIHALNADENINGILLQLPLPDGCHKETLLAAIDPRKDVDGLHTIQRGRLFCNQPCIQPCTPKGIMRLLSYYDIEVAGKHAVVVGRSQLVGTPLSTLLLQANATVTTCHSHTANLGDICREADILCVAVGHPGLITSAMVKPGAVVIDVGINRVNGRTVGDVDFDGVATRCSYISPVPGGVGPMTVAMLMRNTLEACKSQWLAE